MDYFAMIPAIGIDRLAIFGYTMGYCMIAPLPYETTAHLILCLYHLEIIFKISGTISHTVAVFHQKEWFAAILFQIFLYLSKCRIHTAVYVKIPVIIGYIVIAVSGTLILRDTFRIKSLCPCQCLLKVAAISAFISHRPHHDTKPVLVTLHHQLHTVNNRSFPYRIICYLLIPTLKAVVIRILFSIQHKWSVCFDICLVNHHKSIAVAHFIEKWCIWIMAGTNGIEVVLLHQGKVCLDLLHANCKSGDRIGVMAVHTTEFNLLSI